MVVGIKRVLANGGSRFVKNVTGTCRGHICF